VRQTHRFQRLPAVSADAARRTRRLRRHGGVGPASSQCPYIVLVTMCARCSCSPRSDLSASVPTGGEHQRGTTDSSTSAVTGGKWRRGGVTATSAPQRLVEKMVLCGKPTIWIRGESTQKAAHNQSTWAFWLPRCDVGPQTKILTFASHGATNAQESKKKTAAYQSRPMCFSPDSGRRRRRPRPLTPTHGTSLQPPYPLPRP
jgi:hypothetical protein